MPPPRRDPGCPFCTAIGDDSTIAWSRTLALPARHPVTPGHTLVVPRRHVRGVFELSRKTQEQLWQLVDVVRYRLMQKHGPDGLKLGLNDGVADGETVAHAQVHVIPHYRGDARGVIRAQQYYDPATKRNDRE